jgi:rhamnose transport system permease protein
VLAGAAWLDPRFVSRAAQLELSTHAAELALLALPMSLIIISGGIDLSVGSTMALAAVVLGLLFEGGAPITLAACAAVATGALAGALNGVFIARIGVHPLIVTLASLAAYRGLAEGISLARPISGFPPAFLRLGEGTLAGIPIPLIIVLAASIAFAAIARRTVLGFRVYAIGDSEPAARSAGIPVNRIKMLLYTASGAAAGLAAVLFIARRNTAKADVGAGIELEVITAVVLGGTSIFGGRGTILGTILGVALIHEVRELVSWHWQHDELILIVIGSILIASVLLNNFAGGARLRA